MIIIISRCVNSYVRDIIRANDDIYIMLPNVVV